MSTTFSGQQLPFVLESLLEAGNPNYNDLFSIFREETFASKPCCFSSGLLHASLDQTHEDATVNVKQDSGSPLLNSVVVCESSDAHQMVPSAVGKRKIRTSDTHIRKNKREGQGDSSVEAEEKKKATEKASTGFVYVKARRGEATDKHSLAERVRRENIKAKMKLLQSLVPGCDKLTSKTVILDEIIKYVRCLKNQVEFLEVKLASAEFGLAIDNLEMGWGIPVQTHLATETQHLSCHFTNKSRYLVASHNCCRRQGRP